MLKKVIFGLGFLAIPAFATEVKYCGKNIERVPFFETVCFVDGIGPERAIILIRKDKEKRFKIVDASSEYASKQTLIVEDKLGVVTELTLYRDYEAGTYPGDGQNTPIFLEGSIGNIIDLKVINLKYVDDKL